MREIKFRAWDKEFKKMRYGFYYSPTYIVFPQKNGSIYKIPTKNMVIMQYTGLKDKNGKEIYEGDVVKETTWRWYGVVKFDLCKNMRINNEYDVNYLGVYIDFIKPSFLTNISERVTPLIEGDIEIIGNIYENPELLKEEK